MRPLRELEPEIDTFGRIPSAFVHVHMDLPQPTPAITRHRMLSSLPEQAVAAFVAASKDLGLFVAELRHLEQAAGLTATFESVKSATGVDLGAILQGQAFGRGVASSRAAEAEAAVGD